LSVKTISVDLLRSLDPDEAAALWAVRRSEGVAPEEEAAFRQWLDLDLAHVDAWDTIQRAWDCFGAPGTEIDAGDEMLAAMRRRALRTSTRSRIGTRYAAAAAFLAAVGVSALVATSDQPIWTTPAVQTSPLAAIGPADYTSAKGQVRAITLADGSRVTLDTDSAVDVAYTRGERVVRLLRGRAFFDVEHDTSRPFSVRASNQKVVALGTHFGVRLFGRAVRVILVEGKVAVAQADRPSARTILQSGQMLFAAQGHAVVSKARPEDALNWQRGYVTFYDDTLSTAVAELNRYTRDQLVIRDPQVAKLRVSGMFKTGDAERFGRALAQVHPVRINRIAPDKLEISRKR
jgi:transmembrane sensor